VNLNPRIRRLHSWVSVAIALPLLVVIASGLLLQVKKQWSWVQPPEQRGSSTTPAITLEALRDRLVADPSLDVAGWQDVDRVDIRPGRGVAKVSLHGGLEVQVDLGTGEILQRAHRRSDLIESLHDGSWFGGDVAKLGVFLPAGLLLLFLWASGVWLFVTSRRARRRKAGRARSARIRRAA